MRLNRVLALLALSIAAGIGLIWIEGQNFRLQQKLAELHSLRERLTEEHARLRLTANRLAAPAVLIDAARDADEPLAPPKTPAANRPILSIHPY